jgi:MFS family permease
MAVGGAMMWPAILGMTYALLPANRAGLAGGLILGAAGFGNAIGPLLGGMLTDTLGWRWIFFLNLPIAAFAMLVTWRVVRDDAPTLADHRIDYGGIVTLSVGLVALLYALDIGVDDGWMSRGLLALYALSAGSLIAFVLIERRVGTMALVPTEVLRNRRFVAACITVLLMSAIFFASLLYLPQLLTKSMQLSAFAAGAGLLPMMATYALTSFVSGPLYEKFGPKIIVSLGSAALAIGIFLLSRVEEGATFRDLVVGMFILGIGVGLFYSSITTAAVTALDPSQASLAGGIVYMFQIAGGSLGLGLNTAIVVMAPTLVAGVRSAFLLDAVLAVVGLAVALLFVGGPIDRDSFRLPDHHRAHAP